MHDRLVETVLLTEEETKLLLGKERQMSNSYQRKMQSVIKQKIKIFEELERPLLISSGFIAAATTDSSNFPAAGSSVSIERELGKQRKRAKTMRKESLGRDYRRFLAFSIPRPLPYQGNALPG